MQQRDDAGQIAVAGALAVAVDGALHLRRAGLDARQAVGHAQAAIVMRVDADARVQACLSRAP